MQVNEIILQIMPVSDWFEWKILLGLNFSILNNSKFVPLEVVD
ncbi:hypothetical protein [Methylophaga sulfidovorans]|nr:hypothetical protein [Methylophaga sulfidovorans]